MDCKDPQQGSKRSQEGLQGVAGNPGVKEGPGPSLSLGLCGKGNSKEIYIKRQCSQEVWLRRLQKQKVNAEPCSLSSVTRGHW